jgi:predicted S18 family serine protease
MHSAHKLALRYIHDRRMRNASDTEDDADKLTDWQGLIADALKSARATAKELDRSTDSDALEGPLELVKELVSDFSSAETCETIRDFLANIRAAKTNIGKLEAALKLAKKSAKHEDDEEALKAIENAGDELKTLKRELHDIEGEIDD